MCDERTEAETDAYLNNKGVTRRGFSAIAAGAGAAAILPAPANAKELVEGAVEITTPDGTMDGYFAHPAKGKHPGVIIWPDIMGIRPAFRGMGKRLAKSGYSVLVVNPYYRSVKGDVIVTGESFGDPDVRARLLPYARSLSPETTVTDAHALVAYMDAQKSVDTKRKMGVTGYCMTGSFAIRTAAAEPARIGAVGSFHGGGLVTDAETSPHLLIPQTTANFLIAIAENDDAQEPEAKVKLREACDAAGRPAEIEVYEGAMHGWCPPDGRAYNEAQAERAWSRLLVLLETALA